MGFTQFNLSPQLFKAITDLGYAEPTPVQAQAIPEALKGRDLRACAQTGTGKTLAFVIPIIEGLLRRPSQHKPSALVLTPTRELAAQIISVTHDLAKHARVRTALILGGANFNSQVRELRAGADIVVATPGRLIDHLEQKTLSLRYVDTLVLDEADRMLDMGFMPAIRRILTQLPSQRQTMLFSATFDAQIKTLTTQFLRAPAVIDLSPSSTAPAANITQMAYPVHSEQKRALLQALLELNNMTSAIVFTRTKHGANRLQEFLQDIGKKAAVIHSNRSLSQRQQALQGFKDRRYQILVATDIAARGIDVKNISHVINFDVPRHSEDYVHRIGRTGRAEAIGEAFTLVAPDEERFLRDIERFIKKPIPRSVIPDFPYQSRPSMFPQSEGGDGGNRTQRSRPPFRGGRPSHGPGRPHHGGGSRAPHAGGTAHAQTAGEGQGHAGQGQGAPKKRRWQGPQPWKNRPR